MNDIRTKSEYFVYLKLIMRKQIKVQGQKLKFK